MTFYYYAPYPTRHHHQVRSMERAMRPQTQPCCEGHIQPGMHHHLHPEGHRHEYTFRMDVESREDSYLISAVLPGIKPEDVDIQIEQQILTIQADTRLDDDEKANWLLRERRRGHFSRSLELPGSLDAEHAQASFENGILTLNIPKAPEALPRSIKVNVK